MAVSWDSSSISTLFSSLSSSKTGFFGAGSTTSAGMLGDYYGIKNGSYGKLMKAYYSQDNQTDKISSDSSSKSNKASNASAVSSAKASAAKDVKSVADSLKTSANNLLDSKLYDKVSSTDKDGNITSAVDTDKVYEAASSFVNSYNKMIDASAKSDSYKVNNNVDSMNTYARVNSKALSNIGITIGSDNKLSIDEEKFKNANMNDVKTMLGSRGSFGYQISTLASNTSYAASNSFTNGYNSSGRYSSYSASSFYDAV